MAYVSNVLKTITASIDNVETFVNGLLSSILGIMRLVVQTIDPTADYGSNPL